MSNICRLCRKNCNDSLRLRDAKGAPNEIYKITKQYFHQKYLEVERRSANPIAVLCMECWRHVSSFNTFQQSILLLLDNLVIDDDQTTIVNSMPEATRVSLETSSIKVEEPTDVITIQDEEPIEIKPIPSNVPGSGQLIVTDCAIQFSTNVGMMEEEYNSTSNNLEFKGNFQPAEEEVYDMEDDVEGSGECDVFVVNEYEKYQQEALDSISSTYGINDQLRDSPEFSEMSRKSSDEMDMIIAKWKPLLDCYLCHEQFRNFLTVKRHFKREHPNDEFYISCCDRKIKYRYRLEEHATFHLDPTSLQCKDCGKCFTAKANLDEHMHYQHSVKQKNNGYQYIEKCLICSKVFTYRTGVYQHMKIRHPKEFAQRANKRRSKRKTPTFSNSQ
ncbi:transcription factor grauzone-like [Haematobia irritans]|uniref:transcription factor grauzone-like n=1 Tax=Haematobia irritans TaxID=7368 RepID=UPI003F4FB7F7